jgi:hypothetical protein
LKDLANARNTINKIARRVKNSRARFVKKHIQISINKLRDRKQIVPQFFNKSDIIQVEVVIYLDDASTSTLPFLSSPKVIYSLCDSGVRLENHFLSPVMCHEQLKSMRHLFSRPPSITYIGQEKVDGPVLGLVR